MLSEFNKILLPQGTEESFLALDSPWSDDKDAVFSLDKKSFNYIFEELISRGAINLALLPDSGYTRHLDSYDKVLKTRTYIVDEKTHIFESLNTFFKPIAEELDIDINQCKPSSTFNYQRLIVSNEENFIRKQKLKSFAIAYENIYPLIIGIREKTQISLELEKTIDSLQALKSTCRSENSRKNCAVLLGLLNTYKPVEVPGLRVLKSFAPLELVDNFEYFLKDELYREYSYHASSLGKIKIKTQETIDDIKRVLSKFLKKNNYSDTIDFGSKIISTSTGVQLPTFKAIQTLLHETTYLPPIISLPSLISTARDNWEKSTRYGCVNFGVNIMQDSIDTEQELSYTLTTSNKEQIELVFKTRGKFYGEEVGVEMIPTNCELNDSVLELFKSFHKSNFTKPITCDIHKNSIKFSDIELTYGKSKIEVRFCSCCQDTFIHVCAQLLSFHQ